MNSLTNAISQKANFADKKNLHAMDPLVNVDGVLPSYYFVDGRAPLLLLAAFLCGSHLSDATKHGAHGSNADLGHSRPLPSRHPRPITHRKTPTFRNLNPSLINPRARTTRRLHAATSQHHRRFTSISLRRAGSTAEILTSPH